MKNPNKTSLDDRLDALKAQADKLEEAIAKLRAALVSFKR